MGELWTTAALSDEPIDYNQFHNKLLVILRCTPDTIFLMAFFILLWNVLVLYHICHLRVDRKVRDISLPRKFSSSDLQLIKSPLALKACGISFLGIILFATLFAETLITVMFVLGTTTTTAGYIYSNALANSSSPLILIVVELYFYCKFSGVPYRSSEEKQRLRKINKILIFWGLMKSLGGGFDIAFAQKEQQIYLALLDDGKHHSDAVGFLAKLVGPIVYTGVQFLTELLPILLVADSTTAEMIFIKSEPDDYTLGLDGRVEDPLLKHYSPSEIVSILANATLFLTYNRIAMA